LLKLATPILNKKEPFTNAQTKSLLKNKPWKFLLKQTLW
jgi:hypothetical protein